MTTRQPAPIRSLSLLRALAVRLHNGSDIDFRHLWPELRRWLSTPVEPVRPDDDWISIELSYGSADGSFAGGSYPPEQLSEDHPWFCLAVLRDLRTGDPRYGNHGVELWFPPSESLLKLRRHPRWDSDNLLGFDCVGRGGAAAQTLWTSEIVDLIVAACLTEPVYLALLLASWTEDEVLSSRSN